MFGKFLLFQIAVCFLGQFQICIALKTCVTTKNGKIKGTALSYNGTIIPAFLGIPFAEPPVGEFLRFKKTVPLKSSWTGYYQATSFRPACLQHHPPNYPWVDNTTLQSEDCLYLNIYVSPKACKHSKKAVMVWIFSGGLSFGSVNLPVYDGRVLASEGDVIVVNVNYRLGILGFISSEEAPGNMGLHDVIVALKWVKGNIAAFGGDPNNVTIFGHSAGAIIAGLMCVSQEAKGLFRRAILQSSSPAYASNDNRKENNELALKVAKAMGCPPVGIIQCLKYKDAKALVEATYASAQSTVRTFRTVVGDDVVKIDPQIALRNGSFNDVDIMIGDVQDECSFELAETDRDRFGLFGQKDPCPKFNKSTGQNYIREMFKEVPVPVKELVVQHYLGKVNSTDYIAIREQTYHSRGDYHILCPDVYFAESYAKKGNSVYVYYFNHISSTTSWEHWMGCGHFDEVPFVFGRPLDHSCLYTKEEIDLSRKLVSAWTNFAKCGTPDRNWPKFSKSKPYFNVLASTRKSYLEQHKENCEFYRSILGFP